MTLESIDCVRGRVVIIPLNEALAAAEEYDAIVVVAQRKDGGINWHAPDGMRAETMMFLLHMAEFQLGLMVTGKAK